MSAPLSISRVDVALRSKILDHCIQMLAKTPMEKHPFPHFVVTGFLPPDFYSDLLAGLPDPQHYEPFGYEKHHNKSGVSNRFRFQFSNECLEKLPARQRQLWCTVRSVLGSVELKHAVFQKLAPGLRLRYGVEESAAKDLSGFALPELFHETEGYSIKPHPDTRKKVVTMQLALASNDGQRDLGTEFYRRSFDPRSWLRVPHGFETVKKMPFTPNTVYAFSVLNKVLLKSWHGRTVIPGDFGVRNSLHNIWYEQPGNANRELIDDANWFSSQKTDHRRAA